jgi:hypothetical protein
MAELEKAILKTEGGQELKCLFNPETITISRKNSWKDEPKAGQGVGRLQYGGAQAGTMGMELIFDTTDTGDSVMSYTGALMGLLEPDVDLPASDESSNNVRPQTVTFNWGDLHSWPAVVTSLDITFDFFSSAGTPLRAKVKVDLQQFEPSGAFGPQNPTSGTPEPHRVHRVQPGETLDRIAARYYGDPTQWRQLAGANGVEDPLTLRPGALLSIPRLTP